MPLRMWIYEMTMCVHVSALVYVTEHLPKAVPFSLRLPSKIQRSTSYLKHSVKITESQTFIPTVHLKKLC